MEIKKIFVAGAGLMGGGIAQVCAQAGYHVTMRDVADEILQKSLKAINWSVGKFVEKGKVAGTVAEIMGRLKVTTDLAAAAEADFVFEAIIENLEAKRKLFAELDKLCPATNHIGDQHLGDPGYRNCRGDAKGAKGRRDPFFQSRPHDESRRNRERFGHFR